MNKAQFIKELRNRLSWLPTEEINRYAFYYSELIDDMVEEGKSQWEAVASLEDMDVIVGRIHAEWPEIEPPPGRKNVYGKVAAILILGLIVYFGGGHMFKLGPDKEDMPSAQQDDGGYTDMQLVQTPPDAGENTLQYVIEELPQSISVAWISDKIEIKPHDEPEILIIESCDQPIEESKQLKYSIKGGILEIEEYSKDIKGDVPGKQLELLLPSELYEDISRLSVATVSADVTFDGVSGEAVSISTVSGHVDCRGGFDIWEAETVSGDITVEETGEGTAQFTTVSGEISLKGVSSDAKLSTTSGDIEIAPGTEDFEIKMASSKTKIDSGGYRMAVRSGAYVSGQGGPVIVVKTISGRVSLSGK